MSRPLSVDWIRSSSVVGRRDEHIAMLETEMEPLE